MLPDRVSNPGPLTYESGALPIALRGPAGYKGRRGRGDGGRGGQSPRFSRFQDFYERPRTLTKV